MAKGKKLKLSLGNIMQYPVSDLDKYMNLESLNTSDKNLFYFENNFNYSEITKSLKNSAKYQNSLKNNLFPKITFYQNTLSLISRVDITADNLAEFVLPLAEFVHQFQPDCIIACDRGARPIGMALSIVYKLVYGKLPTFDGTVRFRRISSSNHVRDTKEHLRGLVKDVLREREEPRFLVLDDWVSSGSTQNMAKSLIYDLSNGKADVKFAVLRGERADATGTHKDYSVEWHDRPDIVGIDYIGFKPIKKYSAAYRDFVKRMAAGIKRCYRKRDLVLEEAIVP